MNTNFDWSSVEPKWRERWSELRVGHADVTSTKPAFVIALPPPNITGVLHMGHASTFSIQDTVCRERRMRGYEVEWAPGTDHAAIATQNVIERQLAEEGLTKEALGRAAFQTRVDAWYEEYGGRIIEQMRRMGYTCDWDRLRFTLDDQYVRAIRLVFKTLFDEGLVYRGPRIVNWCPYCHSAISDEEIDWREQTDTLYYLKYPVEGGQSITVATVRPETMLGDTGVAVAPGDSRYASLLGKHVTLPLTWRVVPIFADEAVRPEFGTGALKVTPGHDPTDYDIGARHSLPIINVIALDGTMDVPALPQFHGMPVDEARTAVAEALRGTGCAGQGGAVHARGRSLRPQRHRARATGQRAVVGSHGVACRSGHRRRRKRRDHLPPRPVHRRVPALDAQYQRLVHQQADLAGTRDSGVDMRQWTSLRVDRSTNHVPGVRRHGA